MFADINEIISSELHAIDCISKAIELQNQEYLKSTVVINGMNVKNGEGSLYSKGTVDNPVYHMRISRDGKRVSTKLGAGNNEIVIGIKQKRYNDAMLSVLNKDRVLLESVVDRFVPYDAEMIDGLLLPVYRDRTGLVNKAPGILDRAEWDSIIRKNGYKMPDDCNIAPDGLEMRSKSEVIIYGILKGYGLVIKYDVELKLRNDAGQIVTVSPDFVILCDDGSLIIIEHLGLLNNPEYFENALKKIHLYLLNGYRLNENLYLTADYAQGKINAQAIDELVEKMILPRVKKGVTKC